MTSGAPRPWRPGRPPSRLGADRRSRQPSRPGRLPRILGAVLVACLCLSGCLAVPRAAPGTLGVVVAFSPLEFVAQRVGGTHLTVIDLVKPGAEPHDLELRPTQVAGVHDAALVVYLRGFQPAV